MFGIGFFELIMIAVFALLFVGPKKLPEMMRKAGKFFVQVKRTTNEVRSTFDDVVRDAEAEIRKEEMKIIDSVQIEEKNNSGATQNAQIVEETPKNSQSFDGDKKI